MRVLANLELAICGLPPAWWPVVEHSFVAPTSTMIIMQEHRRKSKQKSSKHTKVKRRHARAQERTTHSQNSGSPDLQDRPQTVAIPDTAVDAMKVTREPTAPVTDGALPGKDVDQMDGLLASISVEPPSKPTVHSTEPGKSAEMVAPRLQDVSGRLSGLVGDGGNNWRRRMQRRAAAYTAEQGTQCLRQKLTLSAGPSSKETVSFLPLI